jgi:hypothetical protein
MEIKIAFNYPDRLVKIIEDFFKKQARKQEEEKRKNELQEKFLKNNPFLDKISKIIIICFLISLIPFLIVGFIWMLSIFNTEIIEKILNLTGSIFFGIFFIMILILLVIQILTIKFQGEKIFGRGREQTMKAFLNKLMKNYICDKLRSWRKKNW